MHIGFGAGSTNSFPIPSLSVWKKKNADVWTETLSWGSKNVRDLLCYLSYVYVQNVICLCIVGRTWAVRQHGILLRGHTQTVRAAARGNEAGIVVWHITPLQFRRLPRHGTAVSDWAELRLEEKPSFRDVLTEACLSLFASVDKAHFKKKQLHA